MSSVFPRTPAGRAAAVPTGPCRRRALWALAALLAGVPVPLRASVDGDLAAAVERARRAAPNLGVAVVDVASGAPTYRFNASTPLIPASNTKLLTTAAAVAALGPAYQFRTPLLARGPVVDGVLQGDLAVLGAGDPNLSGRFHSDRPLAVFDGWRDRLRDLGIRRVAGSVVLVDGVFDREWTHPSWPPEQADRWYQAPVGGLSFNDNCVIVRVRPGRAGEPAAVEVLPPAAGIEIDNRAVTSRRGSRLRLHIGRTGDGRTLRVSGSLAADWPVVERWLTVGDPVAYFGHALLAALAQGAIEVPGGWTVRETLPAGDWRQVDVLRSDLLTTLEVTNRRSQNFYAESLLKLLGLRRCRDGSWQGGTRAVLEVLEEIGVRKLPRLSDGSGMSRGNRVSADTFTEVLVAMAGHPSGGEFLQSLPWGGQRGTTLANRFRVPPYRGNVFAKTGYLNGVTALSGYAKGRSGRLYAFSILINGAGAGQRHVDAIVRTLIDAG